MTELLTGFVLGLAGGGHCLVMCGPLALAWRQQAAGARMRSQAALYHGGRIGVYAVLGAAAGLAGQVVSSSGSARGLSIAAGAVLVVMAAGRFGVRLPGAVGLGVGRVLGRALGRARSSHATHPAVGALIAGGLNALLPCGLLYAALTGAAAVSDPLHAALSMVAFGVGTTPLARRRLLVCRIFLPPGAGPARARRSGGVGGDGIALDRPRDRRRA